MVAENAPLCARIQAKVDEVVRLLREELQADRKEHWVEPLKRINAKSAKTGIRVILTEGSSEPPHGNAFLQKALSDSQVTVIDRREYWELRFRFYAWKTADEIGPAVRATGVDSNTRSVSSEGEQKARTPVDPSAPSDASGEGDEPRGLTPRPRSPVVPTSPVYNEAFLIREFDRRQAKGPIPGFIYTGFIINDLLPGLGFSPIESRRILRQLEAKGIVTTVTKSNPDNPDRRTTFVELNRDHPLVRKILGNGQAALATELPLGRSRGELGSELLIRERR